MKQVEVHVAKRQAEFAQHRFFSEERLGFGLPDLMSVAPDLTFWVMAFQDILRLNAALTTDPQIRKIVRHHRAEDAGHERWFLDDLTTMQLPAPDVRWLFGKRHTPTRDAAYALMSEVYRTRDDRLRLVLVKTLESAGHVFFGSVAQVVERAGWSKFLKYFSFSHLEVEKNHEVFEQEIARYVSSLRFSPAMRADAKALVDRCYAAFGTMFDALCATESASQDVADGTDVVTPAIPASLRPRARGRVPRITVPPVAVTVPRQARARS
jgi:hypothetical protein